MNVPDGVRLIPCHGKNHGGSRPAAAIQYLVYHYTGNVGDTARNNALYYQSAVVGASAHYFVDDGGVIQSVPDLTVAWAVGGKKWRDCPQTGGGTLYGIVTNSNSLSIELCGTKGDGSREASEKTLENAAALGRELMEKYHIGMDHVVRHFDVTGKHCPAYLMDPGAWAAFKKRLEGEEMKLYRYVAEMPQWARPAAEKAVRNGYIKMDETGAVGVWEVNLQALVWLDRAGLLDKPAVGG